jgi:hypothetical protein
MYLFKFVGYKLYKYAQRNKKIENDVIIPKAFPSPQNPWYLFKSQLKAISKHAPHIYPHQKKQMHEWWHFFMVSTYHP